MTDFFPTHEVEEAPTAEEIAAYEAEIAAVVEMMDGQYNSI